MIVNYHGILGCECRWDENTAYLVAPEGTAVQPLMKLGFYCAQDGRWYKQLFPQESAYLESKKNMAVVDFPEYTYSGSPYSLEESPEAKKKAHILCLISLILNLLNFVLVKTYKTGFFPIIALFGLVAFILMIYVRVKYPRNKFGLALMILYIIELVSLLILVITVISWCFSCLNDCTKCS